MDNGAEVKPNYAVPENLIGVDENYLSQLMAETEKLGSSFPLCSELLAREIARVQSGQDKEKYIELHNDKPLKLAVKVRVPVKEFPKFNFVGKILGPKGNSMKRIQEDTGTRMAVFGRGSMRDKQTEEKLRKEGGKYAHLNEELHVSIEAFAHPVDCYGRLSHALYELRRHLVPDYNDEVTQSQVQELRYLNGEASSPMSRGRGSMPLRNSGPVAGDYPGPRGRGAMLRAVMPYCRDGGGRGSGGNMGYGTYSGMMPMGRGSNVHPQQVGAGVSSVRPGSAGAAPGASFPDTHAYGFRQY